MMENFDKLTKNLDEYDPQARETILGWAKSVERAMAATNLREHLVIVEFVKTLESKIQSNRQKLSEDDTLDIRTRDRLIDQNRLFQEFIGIFTAAEITLSEIEEAAKRELTK